MVIKAQLKMDQLGRQRWTMAHEGNHFSGLLCISRRTSPIPFRVVITSYYHWSQNQIIMWPSFFANEDVLFHWSIAAAGFDVDDVGVFIRKCWIEQYKQTQKKSTQCSKSLHQQLYTNMKS